MAGENIVVYGTSKTLEANGGSCATGSIAAADDSSYNRSTDGSNYPDAEVVLSLAYATATGIEGKIVNILYAEQNVSGTNDEQAPETNYKPKVLCSFAVNDVTATQYFRKVVRNVPAEFLAWLHNDGTGQTISAGWTLSIIPRSNKAA